MHRFGVYCCCCYGCTPQFIQSILLCYKFAHIVGYLAGTHPIHIVTRQRRQLRLYSVRVCVHVLILCLAGVIRLYWIQ